MAPHPDDDGPGAAGGRAPVAGLIAAIVLLALNLRSVIASLPPLLETVRADLGLSATVGGLITTLPVLAFGLLAPLAPVLARRVPPERALAGCALLTAAAAALRGVGGLAPLLLGNLGAGAAAAIAQGLLPLLIRVRHPQRTGLLIGAYAMSLNLGAALGAGASSPLGDALGWRGGLATWAVPALLAVVVWTMRPAGPAVPAPVERVGRDGQRVDDGLRRTSWAIAVFFGIQSCAFYAGLSWLPAILEADGASQGGAGLLQAIASVASIPAGLVVPILAARSRHQTAHLLFSVGAATAGVLGLLLAPGVPLPWVVLLGLGQGSALAIALTLPSLRGAEPAQVARLTAHSLLVGYVIGAAGPWILGGVHDLTDAWTGSLVVLVAITLLELAPGLRAVRGRYTAATARM